MGLVAVEEADQALVHGEVNEAESFKTLAMEFLDIAIGNDPITGIGRSVYEFFSGKNLVTGAELHSIERGFAFLGIATGGVSKWAAKGAQTGRFINKLYRRVSHLFKNEHVVHEAITAGTKIVAQAEKHGIKIVTGPTASKIDKVIIETLEGKANLTSQFKLTTDEALDAGKKWVGKGYKERRRGGIFVSADGKRQFRIENGSITGVHNPNIPHIHLEEIISETGRFTVNNHVPFGD